MATPAKFTIMQFQRQINDETTVAQRNELVKFLLEKNCKTAFVDSANGTNLDLDKLPEDILIEFARRFCEMLGIPNDVFG